jgi:hypothetical protein
MTKRLFQNQLDDINAKRKRLKDERDRVYARYCEHLEKLAAYRVDESKRFLMSQSQRIVHVNKVIGWKITLDNGFLLSVFDSFEKVYVERYDAWFWVFTTRSGEWQAKTNYLPSDEYAKTKAALIDIFPEIARLVTEIFPIWHKALQEMDEESLMTTRVLHWIAKQLHGTAWPDILRDFVIKRI